ncbi:MAG: preprotein translocase subunit SecE [Candidatus Carbobacillus altaicus]|nr:preprotein translocase subunit SecE [Candidatus Carbobacillus altaicus]
MSFLARIGAGFKRTGAYFRESWLELKKVKWPTRRELTSYTLVVLGTVAAMTLFFYVLDVIFNFIISLIMR